MLREMSDRQSLCYELLLPRIGGLPSFLRRGQYAAKRIDQE